MYGFNEAEQSYETLDEVYVEMLKVAFSYFHSKEDALDVVQESWVKILTKYDTLQDKHKFVQWAKAIVRNTALNEIRRRVYRKDWEKKWVPLMPKYCVDNPMAELLWTELISQVPDVDTRRIINYKFKHDWKDEQIANQLGCPSGTIKSRIRRYKLRKKKELTKHERA